MKPVEKVAGAIKYQDMFYVPVKTFIKTFYKTNADDLMQTKSLYEKVQECFKKHVLPNVE